MITSSYENLKNCSIENYHETKITKREKYISFLLFYSSMSFLVMELILFYYAIIIAKNCSKNKDEMIINIILSIIFTTPYVFFTMLSNPCVKDLFVTQN